VTCVEIRNGTTSKSLFVDEYSDESLKLMSRVLPAAA